MNQMFTTIAPEALDGVTGGKGDANEALTAMLTQISSSIKELANNNQSKSGFDPMMMMMMMMMGKGGGGGGAQVAAAPPPEPPPVQPNIVRVSVG